MNIFFADLDLGDDDDEYALVPHQDLLIERQGNIVRLGVADTAAKLTLQIVHSIMQTVDQSTVRRDAKLIWSFSSVSIVVSDLRALLDRWDDSGEPPLLSIIALVLGEARHVTRGLAAFVGHEIAAQFADPKQSRDAARNLARLARYAIVNGGLAKDATYEAIDGHSLRIDWSHSNKPVSMVNILL